MPLYGSKVIMVNNSGQQLIMPHEHLNVNDITTHKYTKTHQIQLYLPQILRHMYNSDKCTNTRKTLGSQHLHRF